MLIIAIAGITYRIDHTSIYDLSIRQEFDGSAPRLFGGDTAHSSTFRSDSFVGSVAAGGSCNVATLTVAPHLHGTHTECAGHITRARVAVCDAVPEVLVASTLVSVRPERAMSVRDEWSGSTHADDHIVTEHVLRAALERRRPGFTDALIVRTRPNRIEKKVADYDKLGAPYFSTAAMGFICDLGVRHLVLDLPSVDRMDDGGELLCHHAFFQVSTGDDDGSRIRTDRTITELAYIDEAVPDGIYLLNLQVPPFATDAAPSRPLLLPVSPAGPVNRT